MRYSYLETVTSSCLTWLTGGDSESWAQRQDVAYNLLESRLKLYPSLLEGRKLAIQIRTLTYAPACDQQEPQEQKDADHVFVCSDDNLFNVIEEYAPQHSNSVRFGQVLSALDGVSKIRLGKGSRPDCAPHTRCAILKKNEDALVTLDNDQRDGAIENGTGRTENPWFGRFRKDRIDCT